VPVRRSMLAWVGTLAFLASPAELSWAAAEAPNSSASEMRAQNWVMRLCGISRMTGPEFSGDGQCSRPCPTKDAYANVIATVCQGHNGRNTTEISLSAGLTRRTVSADL